jgi:uncharacterized protein (TIGR01244 family)
LVVWDKIELSHHVKVGRRPPGERELDSLRQEGVRAIIDLRTHDEAIGDAVSPRAEATHARARGMDFIHVPVSAESVDKTDLDRVGEALRDAPKPVLIHDSGGNRAGMIALVHASVEAGVPGSEMMEMARNLDLVFGDPAQQEVFTRYVDQRETRPDPLTRRVEAVREEGRSIPLLPEDTGTLAREIQEEHHRKFAQDEAHVVAPTPAPMEMPPAVEPAMPRPIVTPRPKLAPAARSASAPTWTPGTSRLASRVKVIPPAEPPRPARAVAWSPSTPAALGMGAAIAAAILLAIDRRLLLPLLIAAGVMGARVMSRAAPSLPEEPPPADAILDHDIEDLEKRVRRLAKRA